METHAKPPSPQELCDSGICSSEDSDGVEFFHCTPSKNLQAIMRDGIRRGDGNTFPGMDKHSSGNVFLSIGYEEAVQWQGMIAEQVLEEVAILQVSLTESQIDKLETDTAAYSDGMVCSVSIRDDIKPSQLKVMDDGRGSLDHVDMSEENLSEHGTLKGFIVEYLQELQLDLSVGDIVLGGKWKNKRMVVKSIDKDELGQPTVNGKSLLTMRIEKDLPPEKQSKQTRDEQEKDTGKLDEEASTNKRKPSIDFYRKMKKSNPGLFNALARQAKFAIAASRKGKTPQEALRLFKVLLAKEEGTESSLDPQEAPDTYGVRLFIDAMLTKPEERSKAKRYYYGILDALVKDSRKTSGK